MSPPTLFGLWHSSSGALVWRRATADVPGRRRPVRIEQRRLDEEKERLPVHGASMGQRLGARNATQIPR